MVPNNKTAGFEVNFVFTYPFLRIASDCDRQMEEMMKKAEKRKEEISESPKLPGC